MRRIFNTVVTVLLSLLSVWVTAVCLICIAVYVFTKKLSRKPSSVFVVNLLVTQLLQGLVVIPAYAIRMSNVFPEGYYYSLSCDVWRLGYMLVFYGTCINVMLVAIDRLIVVQFSFSKKIQLSKRTCFVICAASWFYILLLCLIPFIPTQRSFVLKDSQCTYNHQAEWSAFMLIGNCAVPFLIVFLCYVRIVYVSEKRFKNIQAQMPRRLSDQSTWVQDKLNKLTIQITLWYAITWLPSIVYYSIITIRPETFSKEFYSSNLQTVIECVIKLIKFFDAVFAPLVYCYNSSDFKDAFNKLFRIKSKRDSVNDTNSTTHNLGSIRKKLQVSLSGLEED